MPRKKRRHFTPEQKVSILREHLLDHTPISEVCETHNLQPSVFYEWQRRFFENGAAAFASDKERHRSKLQKKIEVLEGRLVHKDYVIARVTEEFVRAKKEFGSP
jgi:transposase-like protein